MANEISRTTTYSGSDITVIAYRDRLDADLLQKIEDKQDEIFHAQQTLKEAQDIASYQQTRLSQLQEEPGLMERIEMYFTSKEDLNAKAQNRALELGLQQGVANAFGSSVRNINAEVLRKEKELAELMEGGITQFELGSLHTISYSSFREKFAIRTLGKVQAKGYTAGPRTISGTLVFNVLQEHELLKLGMPTNENTKGSHPAAVMLDMIQPFNLLLIFANEYGSYSSLNLFDVTLFTEGQVMSIDEAVTRNTMNFYATEMVPMKSMGNAFNTFDQMIQGDIINALKQFNSGASGDATYRSSARLDAKLNLDEIQKMREESRRLF